MNSLSYRTQFTKHKNDVELQFNSGLTVYEALEKANIPICLEDHLHVSLDGEFVEFSKWKSIIPKENSMMRVTLIPSGGNSDSNLRMLGALAIAFAAPWATGVIVGNAAWATGVGAAFWGAMSINIGITMLGHLALNSLFPPPDLPALSDREASPALSIRSSNRANLNGPVQRIYGFNKTWPPLGAQPFTVPEGGDQYLYQLFDLGYGPLQLSNLKIGDTDIDDFNEVIYHIHPNISGPEDLVWYTNDIETESVNVSMSDTDIITKTSKTEIKYVHLDLVFSSGLVAYGGGGNEIDETVNWKVRVKDDTDTFLNESVVSLSSSNPDDVTVLESGSTGTDNLFYIQASREDGFTCSITVGTENSVVTDYLTIELTRVSSSESGTSQISSVNYSAIRSFKTGKALSNFRVTNAVKNLMLYPEEIDQWGGSLTVDSNAILSPIGTLTADKLTDNNPTSAQYREKGFVINPLDTTLRTGSVYLKKGSIDRGIFIWVGYNPSVGGSPYYTANLLVDLVDISVTEAGGSADIDYGIEPVGDDWYRVWVTIQHTGNPILDRFFMRIQSEYWPEGGVALGYFYAWGIMMNDGPLAPYNPLTNESRVPHVMVEMKIKATDQLSGAIDKFNCEAHSLLRTWDGTKFVWEYTSDPAWIYADLLTGTVNQRPKSDDRIDWDKLKLWADSNSELVYLDDEDEVPIPAQTKHTCNFILDYEETLFNVLKSVAAVGRATLDIRDDYYSIIFDEPKTVKKQIFSNLNSSGFKSSKVYTQTPDAIKVSYVDPGSEWQLRDVIVYNDGKNVFNSEIIEEISSPMTTSHNEAWRLGRLWLKEAILRQETSTITVDLDWLECSRGDLVGLQMDVMKTGGSACRVSEVNGTVLELDSSPTLNGNGVEFFELRPNNGEIIEGNVAFYHVSNPKQVDIGVVGAREGDLIVFNSISESTYDVLVKQISVNADYTAQLTFIEYAPEMFDLETDLIPVYDPQISNVNNPIYVPEQLLELSAYEVITFTDGLPYMSITLQWRLDIGVMPSFFKVYKQNNDTLLWEFVGNTEKQFYPWKEDLLAVNNAILNVQQNFAVVAVSDSGEHLEPQLGKQTSIIPSGDSVAPEVLDYFVVEDTAERFRRFWWKYDATVKPEDFAGIKLRYTRGIDNWNSSTPLHDGILVEPPFEIRALPEGAQNILLKTIDTSGNLSSGTAKISFSLGDRLAENVLATTDLGYPWDGSTILGSSVIDVNNDLAADPATTGLMWNIITTTLMWNSDTDLMWESAYNGFTYIKNFTTTEDGIVTLNWSGVGEFKYSYFEGTYPDDFNPLDFILNQEEIVIDQHYDLTHSDWTEPSYDAVTTANTSIARNGEMVATNLNDNSVGATLRKVITFSIESSKSYTVSLDITKDNDETRFPGLYMKLHTGGTGIQTLNQINTKTGAHWGAGGVIDNGGYWTLWITLTNTTYTDGEFQIRPASGLVLTSQSSDANGSIEAWCGAVVEGSVPFEPITLLSIPQYIGSNQGIIPYTSPVYLESGDYGVIIECPNTTDLSAIDTLTWDVDVPDINEVHYDQATLAGGSVIALTKTYTQITAVSLTMQTSPGAVTAEVTAKNPGAGTITVQCFDVNQVGVAGLVDIRVQGY